MCEVWFGLAFGIEPKIWSRYNPKKNLKNKNLTRFMYRTGSEPYPHVLGFFLEIFICCCRVACEKGEIPKLQIVFDEFFYSSLVFPQNWGCYVWSLIWVSIILCQPEYNPDYNLKNPNMKNLENFFDPFMVLCTGPYLNSIRHVLGFLGIFICFVLGLHVKRERFWKL